MKHRLNHVLLFLVCILYMLCTPSLAQYNAGQSFSLPANYVVYPSPAMYDPDSRQIVKLACSANTRQVTRTTERIDGLGIVPAGETFTILKLTDCYDSNRIYAQIQTQHNVIGYIPLPSPSTPVQQTVSVPKSAQPAPNDLSTILNSQTLSTPHKILIYIFIAFILVGGTIWFAWPTPEQTTQSQHPSPQPAPSADDTRTDQILNTFKIGISTIAAVFLTHYGHEAMGVFFVFFMWWFIPYPWVGLMFNWHNPSNYKSWGESGDFTNFFRLGAGVAIPLILFGFIATNYSFHAALCIVFGLNTLLCWYLYIQIAAARRAKAAAEEDTERKKHLIVHLTHYAAPLSRFLSQYHPDWYPPPISNYLKIAIATYATFLRDLARAKRETPSTAPDEHLIRSPFTERSFPDVWDYKTTDTFCNPIWKILYTLMVSSEFTLEENAQLVDSFAAKTDEELSKAEEHLPPELRERIHHILDTHESRLDAGETEVQIIATISARLTALIPEYVAQNSTVIGAPPDGLPVAYDSLESRYRHTFLIGSSGSGKSTTITNLVVQDIHKGYGVIVMSPDENLMHRIAPYIPEHRLDDVIYVDPGDTTSPIIGFNPLFFDAPSDTRDYDRLKRWKAAENYAVLMRTLNIDTEPTKNLLNHTMYALTGRPNTTLNDLRRLIDPKERALHVEIANDSRVDTITREFWRDYATEGANAMVYRNLSSRIVPLLRPPLFDIFSTQSLSFHRELNEHARIVLIDLSNMGSRDSQEAKIASQLLIATIHQTMLRRDKMKEADYIPYFMYIDEFQQYADTNENSISAMAEQIRKYHFGLTLTSLVVSDLSTALFDKIIGVMSTFICLSMSAKDARRFADEMSIKHPTRDSYNAEALQKLKVGQAYVKTPPLDAAVFVNMPREPLGNLPKLPTTIDDLKQRSKANFGAIGKPSAPAAVDPETRNMDVLPMVSTPPPTQQPPPKPRRKRRTRFDDDAANPEIEVS